MKRYFLLGSAFLVLLCSLNAQNKQVYVTTSAVGHETLPYGNGALKTASTPTLVSDVLHYYLNKYYFKTGKTDVNTYPYTRTNATRVVNAVPPITYVGSRFDVPAGETVTVTGLEAYAQRAEHLGPNIPIRIYLCNLDAQNMPILPGVDSIDTQIGGSTVLMVGGNFTTTTIRTMTANFAVLFRNASDQSGNYVNLMRTNGAVGTNWMAAPSDRCSDGGYGYIRYNGNFVSTKDFTSSPGFGVGTDYEFLVAPRVEYSIQAGQTLPQGVVLTSDEVNVPDTNCTRVVELQFTNTSSPFYEHRMYNLNQFYRKWNLYDPFVITNAFSADSAITWYFEFLESTNETRVFLPYVNNGTIKITTGDGSRYPGLPCFVNQFRARFKPMAAFGSLPQLAYNEDFITCFKFCDDDAVGISTIKGSDKLNVYPNPAVNGKSLITGLEGKNTIIVYDMLGQVISNEISEGSSMTIDLSSKPKGTYVVRISGSDNQSKTVKIINQN